MKSISAGVKILTVCYVLILAGIIFVADRKSTQYLLNFIGNIPYGDKLGHFFLMGMFSFLLNLSFNCYKVWGILIGNLIVAGVVTIEEFSQIFVRGRTFDWTDLISDFLGIFIFGELARLIFLKFRSGNQG